MTNNVVAEAPSACLGANSDAHDYSGIARHLLLCSRQHTSQSMIRISTLGHAAFGIPRNMIANSGIVQMELERNHETSLQGRACS